MAKWLRASQPQGLKVAALAMSPCHRPKLLTASALRNQTGCLPSASWAGPPHAFPSHRSLGPEALLEILTDDAVAGAAQGWVAESKIPEAHTEWIQQETCIRPIKQC